MTRWHRYRQVIGERFGFVFMVVAVMGALVVLLLWLGSAQLLDLTTIVSVMVAELGISFVLYYLFGQGHRSNEEEIVNQMDAAEKLSHLKVYTFSVLKIKLYFVENTSTKEYYEAPESIENMVDRGIISPIPCKNEEEMRAILEKNGSHENKQKPTIIQLLAIKHRRKQTSADSDSAALTK